MKETDLYPPLKRFLEAQGYTVKSEIGSCDVVAVRGDEAPLVVELKLTLNLDVVLQAVDRLALTHTVYIGIPENNNMAKKRHRHVKKLLRMLGLGWLQIAPARKASAVSVLLDPEAYRPRQSTCRRERLLGEFVHRVGDPNLGGATRKRGIVTAYRQRAVAIARHLRDGGPATAHVLSQALGDPHAHRIVYKNVYGWFERVSRGVYGLSPRGASELAQWLEKCCGDG